MRTTFALLSAVLLSACVLLAGCPRGDDTGPADSGGLPGTDAGPMPMHDDADNLDASRKQLRDIVRLTFSNFS